MKTKKELHGKTFQAIRKSKGLGIESIPAMRESFLAQVAAYPEAEMTETDTAFEFNNGQFILKPTKSKESAGVMVCGSTFITFEGIRIEYKDITINSQGFDTNAATYIIKEN